ncbi:MAG: hypothetical protein CMJ39_12565 [Phycisphaerae bacterium]|nr:hypothetical protein [Phycisphaerae bacterium]|tara:strand:- start:1008 stop:2960 length:1953 start_codon:yes stop_codon:yes gene_type:complete
MLLSLLVLLLAQAPAMGEIRNQEVPWPVTLGAKSLYRANMIPMVDQVVIVPDVDTYLDELARWSKDGQWPILIEDDHLVSMLVRRLKPDQVIQREAVAPPGPTPMQRLRLIQTRAWGAASGETFEDAMKRNGLESLGLVLTSESATAFPAAAALAVGRGQSIAELDGKFGGGGTILGTSKSEALAKLVQQRCEQTGLSWQSMGDQIDAITVCRNLPSRARMRYPSTARVQAPNVGAEDPLAITDILGRLENGDRFAIVGWINGSTAQSSYMAMCSLFLKPDTALLCNGYPKQGQWLNYALEEADAILKKSGFSTTMLDGRNMRGFRSRSSGGLDDDLILINSKGNRDFFELGQGRGTPDDIPVLSSPAALSMIHSWSLVDPSNAQTVGGRWLEHGVYAYVGSAHEPYLPAFLPASEFVQRLSLLVPFLVAGRWWQDQGPFSGPWRINTLGDPLMTMGPPKLNTRPRIAPTGASDAAARGLNLRTKAEQLMREMATSPDKETLALCLRALNLIGEDELARQMWIFGEQHHVRSEEAAEQVLGPLFRLQDRSAFIEAWRRIKTPTRLQRDMLWQLLGPSLTASTDDDVLMLLEKEVKGPTPSSHIELLAPHLAKRYGSPTVVRLIERASRTASTGQERQKLDGLKQQYSSGR